MDIALRGKRCDSDLERKSLSWIIWVDPKTSHTNVRAAKGVLRQTHGEVVEQGGV